ncbi:MAG: hypothetical protein KBA31_11255 [Alphaproteobacteria bacterium]|nr:hypothetical protein [Alphaproteobacteria bacterium]
MPPADEQLWILAGLAVVAAILGLVVRHLLHGRPKPLPKDGPMRLLIRPLKELKPDPNHLYLGTTIARELTASLKRFERLEPLLSESAAALVLEGTVRKTGPRVVMNLRLANGRHALWRGTYDGAINDLAYMQDEIVAHVTRTLKVAPRKQPAAQPSVA